MNAITSDILLNQLRWRYAVKRFDSSRRIDEVTWSSLEQALVLTPSSFGLQPWRFLVVVDEKIKAELPKISWGQSQPKDCSHMVVLATRRTLDSDYIDQYLASIIQTRGGEAKQLDGYRAMMLGSVEKLKSELLEWNSRQVFIALGQLMTAAAMLGVDTCPMEGIEPEAYDALLGLSDSKYTTTVACAVGYRHPEDKYALAKKVRFSPEFVVQRV